MSMLRALSPSIAALGFSATILGVGLSCALTPAWAEGQSCEKQIADLTESAQQQADADKMDKALTDLADARGELVNEGDEEDCLSQRGKAKKLLEL